MAMGNHDKVILFWNIVQVNMRMLDKSLFWVSKPPNTSWVSLTFLLETICDRNNFPKKGMHVSLPNTHHCDEIISIHDPQKKPNVSWPCLNADFHLGEIKNGRMTNKQFSLNNGQAMDMIGAIRNILQWAFEPWGFECNNTMHGTCIGNPTKFPLKTL